jgi:hypothetical protein
MQSCRLSGLSRVDYNADNYRCGESHIKFSNMLHDRASRRIVKVDFIVKIRLLGVWAAFDIPADIRLK